ncbi:kinase-like domain-containing protein [Trametes elegans]|nr:kinase-like domain-containing protein [Trametes elegans]
MCAQVQQRRPPSFAYLSDEVAARYAQLTSEGVYDLMPKELFWQARQRFLAEHGYLLRPRYIPGWRPSWSNTKLAPTFCEDSILLIDYQVMDATRVSTKEIVAIKTFFRARQELDIAQFLSSISDPLNHCVPIHEILIDPHDPKLALMVMPYLRPCNNPDFGTIGDIIEFVDQTLEGLVFMHKHRVAHRDVAVENIMMDAKPLYPEGHHPVRIGYTPDGIYPATPLPRAGRSVKYFYIDFGLSSRFSEGESSQVVGELGRDRDVPELSADLPYDAFKVDIFCLGNLYSKEFEQKYQHMDFLLALIEPMTKLDPALRPTAEQAFRQWEKTRATIADYLLRWRLARKTEQALERVVNDTVAVAREGIYYLRKLVTS